MSDSKPTDAEILSCLYPDGWTQTFHVAQRLNRRGFRGVDTPWVYRRLRRFERHKLVSRDYGSLWGNTVFWKVCGDE